MRSEAEAARTQRGQVLALAGGALVVAVLALLWPAAADAQRPLRKPCLDPKGTLNVATSGGTASFTAREPLLNCINPGSGTTFTTQQTCTFHCQHWHTWVPTGVPLEPNIQLSATLPANTYLLGWSPNCTPTLGQARADCTVRVRRTSAPTAVTATLGSAPDPTAPTAPGAPAVTPSSYTAVVQWAPASDTYLAGYDIFRSGRTDPVARVGPGTTRVTVRDLFCRSPYSFRVEAFDTTGNGTSSTETQTMTGGCGPISPPNTMLHLGPPRRTTSRTAFFHFGTRGAIRASRYQCKLDRGAWRRCRGSTGKRYRNIRLGTHMFRVRAGNSLGFDRTPATYRWRIVRG